MSKRQKWPGVPGRRLLMCVAGMPAVLVALLSASCREGDTSGVAPAARPVKVQELHGSDAVKSVELPGQVRAVRRTWKAFEVEGRITDALPKEGQTFKKGEVLAQLDPRDFQAARDSAKARYEAAVIAEGRLKGLYERKAVAKQQYELSYRDLITAKADYDRAEKALEDTRLIADFDGTVAKVVVDDYANVKEKANVMLLVDTSSLEIVVDVPESLIASPLPGETHQQRAERTKPVVIPSAMPGYEFPATFVEASDTADPVTRTYAVALSFTPPKEVRVHPGMTAKVRATVPANPRVGEEGIPVPVSAVFSDHRGDSRLWLVDRETLTVQSVPVHAGSIIGERMLVTGGVDDGDLIAVSGVGRLREGDPVRIWEGR